MSRSNLRFRKIIGEALDQGRTSIEVGAMYGIPTDQVRRLFVEYNKDRRALEMLRRGTEPVLVAATLRIHASRVQRLAEEL